MLKIDNEFMIKNKILQIQKIMRIKGFTLDKRKDSTLKIGKLYYRKVTIPCAKEKYQERMLRVWVPRNFDINKEYGVLYMSDGQNAVDESLTMYGEWNMEEHFDKLTKQGYPEFIIVGIDCAKNARERKAEYLPIKPSGRPEKAFKDYYGDKFAQYFVETFVPLINETFNINQDLVGFCGSSMGGLISLYFVAKYPKIFKFCLSYSPALSYYKSEHIIRLFNERKFNPDKDPSFVFFLGGADRLEKEFAKNTDLLVSLFIECGYPQNKIHYQKDLTRIHHETSWSDNIEESLKFILQQYLKK